MSNRNYYKGISLNFKEKQKEEYELEAYFRESMKSCCYTKSASSVYSDDEYYDIPDSNDWFECILNIMFCGFMFGIHND
jgi:hypothetical protein